MKTIPKPAKIMIAASILVMAALVHGHVLQIGDAGQIEEDALSLLVIFFL